MTLLTGLSYHLLKRNRKQTNRAICSSDLQQLPLGTSRIPPILDTIVIATNLNSLSSIYIGDSKDC